MRLAIRAESDRAYRPVGNTTTQLRRREHDRNIVLYRSDTENERGERERAGPAAMAYRRGERELVGSADQRKRAAAAVAVTKKHSKRKRAHCSLCTYLVANL